MKNLINNICEIIANYGFDYSNSFVRGYVYCIDINDKTRLENFSCLNMVGDFLQIINEYDITKIYLSKSMLQVKFTNGKVIKISIESRWY